MCGVDNRCSLAAIAEASSIGVSAGCVKAGATVTSAAAEAIRLEWNRTQYGTYAT